MQLSTYCVPALVKIAFGDVAIYETTETHTVFLEENTPFIHSLGQNVSTLLQIMVVLVLMAAVLAFRLLYGALMKDYVCCKEGRFIFPEHIVSLSVLYRDITGELPLWRALYTYSCHLFCR